MGWVWVKGDKRKGKEHNSERLSVGDWEDSLRKAE